MNFIECGKCGEITAVDADYDGYCECGERISKEDSELSIDIYRVKIWLNSATEQERAEIVRYIGDDR